MDTELLQFTLPDGSSLLVEVDDQEPGIQRASRVDDLIIQAKTSLDGALDQIRAMATLTLTKLQDLPRRPDDLEVEFGVRLNAEAGAVIAQDPSRRAPEGQAGLEGDQRMSDAEHQPWRARIRRPDGRVVGAGFLVDDQHVVTCAHLVAEALRIPATGARPDGSVLVDFPAAGVAEPGSAAVRPDGWISIGADDRGDVAVLQLQGDPRRGWSRHRCGSRPVSLSIGCPRLAIRTGSSMASGPMGRCRGRVVPEDSIPRRAIRTVIPRRRR